MAKSAAARKTNLPQWNLKDFYKDIKSPHITQDIQQAESFTKEFIRNYTGKVEKLSVAEFRQAVKEYETLSDLLGKLGSYASLVYAGDMNKAENTQFYQNIQEKINTITSELLFFTLSINKLDDANAERILKSEEFAHYAPWLRELRILKPYQLADDIEKLLHDKQVTGHSAWSRHFDEVTNDLRFPVGKKKLAMEQVLHLMSEPKQSVRKEAALSIGKVLGENIKTFALITNTIAKDKEIEDTRRGFARPISSRNIANQVEDEVVEALMKAVRGNYKNLSHRYYKLKAKWLGKKELQYWDRAAQLPKVPERKYVWSEAVELVLSAYMAFSPELGKIGAHFFEHNWVDAQIRPGKATGAFAHPCVPSVHPYLLVNYQGRGRDVMTVAHELGHGIHQYLSRQQGALLADTPLTLAETASVFGEQLAFRELLGREKNVARRKSILAGKVEDMLATVVRQIAMCEYEVRVHDARRSGELTSEQIGKIWLDTQSEALGRYVKIAPECRHFWAYIPHFIHTPFYVYAYAFGDCLVNSLYSAYEKEKAHGRAHEFEKKYIEMLSSGGRYRHKELLAPFGLDASKPSFWQGGLDVLAKMIDELEDM